jgi:hypothetical protein
VTRAVERQPLISTSSVFQDGPSALARSFWSDSKQRARLSDRTAARQGCQCWDANSISREVYPGPTCAEVPDAGAMSSRMARRLDRCARCTRPRLGRSRSSGRSGTAPSGAERYRRWLPCPPATTLRRRARGCAGGAREAGPEGGWPRETVRSRRRGRDRGEPARG